MRKILLPAILILLIGCDYDIPLSQTASAPADPALAGTWIEASTNSNPVSMEIKTEGMDYIITYTETDTEAGTKPRSFTFKGFEVHAAGLNLIQLEWQQADAAESKEKYVFAKLELTPEGLSVYRLNPVVVSAKCQTSEELLADIIVHKKNSSLFNDPLKFSRSADR